LHNNDSFIDEVSEEVRRDRFYSWLRRWRWVLITLVVLIVGGAAVNEWRKLHWASRSEAAGDAFRAAFAEPDPAARAADFGSIAEGNARAAVLARIAEAGALAEAGDSEAAAAILAAVAGDGSAGELYRSLAALQRVMLLGSSMEASERQATLELLANPGAPFRPLALEQRALMQIDAGDKAGAIADLEAVLAEPAASEPLRARARQLIVAVGGTVPEPAAPAADG
jgi:hypothetical protein